MADTVPHIDPTAGSTTRVAVGVSPTYEQLMSQDLEWAMTQGSLYFEGEGKVQETLKRITRTLDELNIPYAVVGGMALFAHGFRRYTEDVDILVTPAGLKRIHQELVGRGYVPPFDKSKHLRDTDTRVKIEFLTTGGYPGDGKEKPVSFPDPQAVVEVHQGIKCVGLPTLVELKLASGMSNVHRGKDITDVEQMIQTLHLSEDFAQRLNPYVRDKYVELWQKLRFSQTRYVMLWRNKWLTSEAKSIEEITAMLRSAAEELDAMQADGVLLDPNGGTSDDYAYFYTFDRTVAEKYGMEPEDSFLHADEDSVDE